MKVEVLKDNRRPISSQSVTVKQMGNITEVRYCTNNRRGCPIEKLDKNTYVDLATGEVRDFEHHEKRVDDIDSISQSIKRLRELINCNVINANNARWLTLTYAENMTDSVRLYEDFKAFNARLRYWLKTNGKQRYEYLAVAEPQRRGAWHLHCFLIFPFPAPFIHYDVIKRAWGHGAIHIKALDNIDNVGAYLTPYLTDISLADGWQDGAAKGIREVGEGGDKKAYIKGGRLKYYPAGFRLYRASRGVTRPVVFDCTEAEALRFVGSSRLTFERTIKLLNEDSGETFNIINYRHFNHQPSRNGGMTDE